jgi:SRSO17 transposase
VGVAQYSLCAVKQLYLPREWAEDAARRKKAEVPATVSFATKSTIALEQLRAARAARVPVGVVLADAGYGNDTDFRLGITELGLTYAVGIQGSTAVWAEGHQPLPPRGDWCRLQKFLPAFQQ